MRISVLVRPVGLVLVLLLGVSGLLGGSVQKASAAVPGLQLVVETTASNSQNKTVTANCPAGTRLTGTGADIPGGFGQVRLDDLRPSEDLRSLEVTGLEDENGTNASWSLKAFAICATPPPGLERVRATSADNSTASKTVTATCPLGKQVIGTAGQIESDLPGPGQIGIEALAPNAGLTAVTLTASEDIDGTTANWFAYVYAICANPLPGLQLVTAIGPANASAKNVSAACPTGKRLTGLGGNIVGGQGRIVLGSATPSVGGELKGSTVSAGGSDDGSPASWSLNAQAICATLEPPFSHWASWAQDPGAKLVRGDFDGDGRTDMALTGRPGWASIPVAFSKGDGSFNVTNVPAPQFASLAGESTAEVITGDFNGDGRTDIALMPGQTGWAGIPIAFSSGDGSFNVTFAASTNFAIWASSPQAKVTTGDFNNDGRTDLALTGDPNWTTIPLALSRGDGTFTIHNRPAGEFPWWSTAANVKVVSGDFNNDGRTDLVLTGVQGWSSIPMALSQGDGSFTVHNKTSAALAVWTTTPNVKIVTGDLNNDGRTDIALTGPQDFGTVPMGLSNGDGTFTLHAKASQSFALWASAPNVKAISGHFNADGRTDIALTGDPGWRSIPVATSNGDGTFGVTNAGVGEFGGWAAVPGAKVVSGDFDGDGLTDIALTGGGGWLSVPVAFSKGDGSFTVTNHQIP